MLTKSFQMLIALLFLFKPNASEASLKKDFYQIKIYHLKNQQQESVVDDFLKNAYLPALHRAGVSAVGVFKPVTGTNVTTEERLIYVFIPFHSRDAFFKLDEKLEKDMKFKNDGKAYLDAPYTEPVYERIETILLNAFEKSPRFTLPTLASPQKERIYELRSYEGHTEKISDNKIQMFNKGDEVGLFKRLGFNAVFYAEVVAGSKMPNLMYLTTFENKAERDKHWDAFGKDEYWKKLSALPEYQHNVSKNVMKFLYPTDYSDI